LIALIAVVTGLAFVPIAVFGAGLPVSDAVVFAVGLLVGNVPEGLLPVITLALAVGVRELVHRDAVVKRLSAVETLGSTNVICTDKTGTLTENRMRVGTIWTAPHTLELASGPAVADADVIHRLAVTMAACNNADPATFGHEPIGDPTEVAMLSAAEQLAAVLARDGVAHARHAGLRRALPVHRLGR
jgi:magnesium-transporting ATPase (P-type)